MITVLRKNRKRKIILSGGSSGAFDPSQIVNLALWLDASDLSTIIESGSSVSEWLDKSGLNNHATQGVAINQPTTGANTINGKNVISFNGIANFLNSAIIQIGSNNVGLYVVVKNNPASLYQGRIFNQRVGAGTRHGLLHSTTPFVGTNFNNGSTYAPTVVLYQQGEHSIIGYRNGNTLGLGYDGVITTSENGADVGTITSSYIGCYDPVINPDFFDGDIAEIVLDLDYSEETKNKMLAYYADKWGV